MIYFTSDTHFRHRRIIELCARPFPDVEAMDEALIASWNATVSRADTVFHLGDFAIGDARDIFRRLNGHKHLVRGNHDRGRDVLDLPWDSVELYRKQKVDGVDFVMFHYPLVEWDGYFRNTSGGVASINVFGHVHSTPTLPKHSFDAFQHDVGVDRNGFRPISSRELVSIVRLRQSDGAR